MNMQTKKFKVVLLGDQAVGKTSLIKRYAEKGFDPDSDVLFYHFFGFGAQIGHIHTFGPD